MTSPPTALGYDEITRRTRELVEQVTPVGATVMVVSKGDDNLVRFAGRAGWHFPRAANRQYAGHHPYDGNWAVEHVEALRAAGGAYFVLPDTYLWWLDHYPELDRHLRSRYELVAREEGVCQIHRLLAMPPVRQRAVPALLEGPSHDRIVPAMRALVCNMLPEDEIVLVASDGEASLLGLGRSAWHFPHDAAGNHVPLDSGDGRTTVAQLRALRDKGVRYLLVPHTGFGVLARHDELSRYLRDDCRTLALRPRVCAIFELAPTAVAATEKPAPAEPRTAAVSRPPRPSRPMSRGPLTAADRRSPRPDRTPIGRSLPATRQAPTDARGR
jgi:hypothetical protein